jgi:DNA modification methylase
MGEANTLYYGDNLDILRRYIADESVDLIYLDPPFNSNADYNVLFAEKDGTQAHAQIKAFGDTWTWDQGAAQEYAEVLRSGHDRVAKCLKGIHDFLGGSDMLAYLSMMALRLIELRRVLKPTGSIYLHCDPTASHYLKLVMDAVFGPENYVNEVIWKRQSSHNDAKQGSRHFGRIHDVLLFYRRSDAAGLNHQYKAYDEDYLTKFYRFVEPDSGRRYRLSDITAPGGASPAKRNPHYEFLGVTRYWRYSEENMKKLYAEGRIVQSKPGGVPAYKRYLDEGQGVPVGTVWDDIHPLHGSDAQKLGYPTQKPAELLERVVLASSNENDVVLDPFCGCGTTIAAAQKLNRRWIGIDITHLAVNLIKVRLADTFGRAIVGTYFVVGEPEDLQSARALAEQDKYQFQYWALGLVGARPMEEKKGADKGIDGRLYFNDLHASDTHTIIISVKGGHVGAAQVRDLRGTIEREGAAIGVFITLEAPTKPMLKEAADAGVWQAKGIGQTAHPRLQILTIEELLAGKRIDMPTQQDVRSFKTAPRAKSAKRTTQKELFE